MVLVVRGSAEHDQSANVPHDHSPRLLLGWSFTACACRLYVVLASSTLGLAIFGAVGAALGGASMLRGAIRVIIGGLIAMGVRS